MATPSPHVNGAGAIDLGARRATAEQKAAMIAQFLTQAGLQCRCGERIRGVPVLYYDQVEGMVQTPTGLPPGIALQVHTVCSPDCVHAIELEGHALARRDGPAGGVSWLDEKRARAA